MKKKTKYLGFIVASLLLSQLNIAWGGEVSAEGAQFMSGLVDYQKEHSAEIAESNAIKQGEATAARTTLEIACEDTASNKAAPNTPDKWYPYQSPFYKNCIEGNFKAIYAVLGVSNEKDASKFMDPGQFSISDSDTKAVIDRLGLTGECYEQNFQAKYESPLDPNEVMRVSKSDIKNLNPKVAKAVCWALVQDELWESVFDNRISAMLSE